MNIYEEQIKVLEKKIADLRIEVGIIDSRIDTLECYRRNDNDLDELYEESSRLENEIKVLEEKITELKRKNNIPKR